MEFMEVVEERRSVRKFYPKPIPMELIGELVHIASRAPSIGDLQPWNFIVVTKPRVLQELADACPYERWLYQAPLIIVVCALSDKCETYYPGKGKLWASHSVAAAAQNICLGAVDVGLGACWVTSFESYKVRETLHIPEGIEPEIMLAVGYPDEQPADKRILPFHRTTFFNNFGKTNTDVAIHKRDYGEFVRDRMDDVKTRAAYANAPRGSLRTVVDKARTHFSSIFRKKHAMPSAQATDGSVQDDGPPLDAPSADDEEMQGHRDRKH